MAADYELGLDARQADMILNKPDVIFESGDRKRRMHIMNNPNGTGVWVEVRGSEIGERGGMVATGQRRSSIAGGEGFTLRVRLIPGQTSR